MKSRKPTRNKVNLRLDGTLCNLFITSDNCKESPVLTRAHPNVTLPHPLLSSIYLVPTRTPETCSAGWSPLHLFPPWRHLFPPGSRRWRQWRVWWRSRAGGRRRSGPRTRTGTGPAWSAPSSTHCGQSHLPREPGTHSVTVEGGGQGICSVLARGATRGANSVTMEGAARESVLCWRGGPRGELILSAWRGAARESALCRRGGAKEQTGKLFHNDGRRVGGWGTYSVTGRWDAPVATLLDISHNLKMMHQPSKGTESEIVPQFAIHIPTHLIFR